MTALSGASTPPESRQPSVPCTSEISMRPMRPPQPMMPMPISAMALSSRSASRARVSGGRGK